MRRSCAGIFLAGCLAGCGSQAPVCGVAPAVLRVSPASASADHDATPPANKVQFLATSSPGEEPGCATPQVIERLTPAWTASDPVHVSISSVPDATNGLATCLGPTTGPATLTAHVLSGTTTVLLNASLFCE